jgi:hypothetical protein
MPEHPHNRPHQVDTATGAFLFTLYKLLFVASVDLRIKQRTFETAADSKNSWRVVSISVAALKHIMKTGDAKGLQRGHMLPRVDHAKYLFNREAPMTQDELLNYFFEHDTVALVTKAENSKDFTTHWSKLHPVPEGLFTAGSFSIYVRKGKEIPWVNSLVAASAACLLGQLSSDVSAHRTDTCDSSAQKL